MLSPYDYDVSFFNRLRTFFSNTVVAETSRQFEEAAAARVGAEVEGIPFPLLGAWRIGWAYDQESENFSATHLAGRYGHPTPESEYEEFLSYKAFPITLNYQLDVWSPARQKADKLTSELIFNLKHYPRLSVAVPNPEEWTLEEALITINDVTESSEPSEFNERGRMYHTVLDLVVSNACIMHLSRASTVLHIPLDVMHHETGDLIEVYEFNADVPPPEPEEDPVP